MLCGGVAQHRSKKIGGERGIRTLGSFTYARFPGVCLKPLSHLSAENKPTYLAVVTFACGENVGT
jgi:hypothetical protein